MESIGEHVVWTARKKRKSETHKHTNMSSVKVAVRVRPVNKREISMNSKCIIEMEGKRTSIINLKLSSLSSYGTSEDNSDQLGRERVKDFFFDFSYWSYDENSPNFTTQSMLFTDLGTGVVQAADEGYNACIFAYGQTGSGKTHTMTGLPGNHLGLIPRICEGLFQQIREKEVEGVSFQVQVSYLEIYNERVRDLLRPLAPKNEKETHTLKVREHPKGGPYVQGLTKHMVSDYAAIETLMVQGNELRTTATTNMNDTSSRSHAIFTVNYTQAKFEHDLPSETTSKINLVDLAGSERADATGATGIRLKEGANINKSLVTLGSVISSLAELSTNTKKKNTFIPYRDSVLTWLLKDSLGGNSKTIMIATISPADCNYAETLSTLRYANRAKNIVNKPTVNEDDNVKLIRDLRAEIDKLKGIIGQEVVMSDGEKATAKKLFENEERLGALTDKWKDRWKEMQNIMQERELAFQHRVDAGIRMESELPHLVALEDDLYSTGVLLYHLKQGKTFVGTEKSKTKPDIVISGPSILDEHCIIENNDGFVLLEPFPDAPCSVNGTGVKKRVRLQQGDVVNLGKTAIFRFNHPKEAEELREKRKSIGPPLSNNVARVNQYRGDSDLLVLPKMRNPERDKTAEALAKELEEARLLLEKQKQEEERRMEETKNEFARQIREESRRLQETRGELESQRKGKHQEPQNIEQIRNHIDSLEQHHREAEDKRLQREKELSENIENKERQIETQRRTLTELETKCLEAKNENDNRTESEVESFMLRRSEETTTLNDEIRTVVDATRNVEDAEKIEEIRGLWESETSKVADQEVICVEIANSLNESFNSFELLRQLSGKEEEIETVSQHKEDLSKKLSLAQASLEEIQQNKAKSLRKYEQDYKNRFEFICWEKEKSLKKVKEKKELCDHEKRTYQESLIDAQSELDEVKARYFNTVSQENELLSIERAKIDARKQDIMKKSIEDQQHFNAKVQQYRSLLKKGQENINDKKAGTEQLRQELTDLMKLKSGDVKEKIELLRVELNDKIEDMHELENNHNIVKNEEEKVIQNMLTELNTKKQQNEKDVEMSDKLLLELEQVSREKVLMLQEEVDGTEKIVLQYRSNIDRCDEKLIEIDKVNEAETAKLDTELLYVAYMIEKKFQKDTDGPNKYTTIQETKTKLQDVYQTFKMNIENIQKESEVVWKPLVDNREKAQVVLENIIRTRGIAEVTLTELKEQFETERKEEVEEIESWRERLVDLEEEKNISSFCSENEISDSQLVTESPSLSVKEKLEYEDDMYQKIILMERTMQAEIDQLKKREYELLTCIEKNKQNKKKGIDAEGDVSVEDLLKLQQLLEAKEKELNVTKEHDNQEIEELRTKLDYANKEIQILHEELEKYVSMTSLTIGTLSDEELSENEVRNLLIRVNESSGIDEEDEEIARLRISPPPTPINRYLQSVNIYRRNQIKVVIPRFILRGIGRDSYHVFEIKLNVGDDHWTVYRRYRRFRELHRQTLLEYPIVANLEFPSKRFFGNRAEKFVKIRRAQLETYLTAFFAIMSNVANCLLYAVSESPLTKQDVGQFHPFFKQGVYEYTKNESDYISR